MTTGIVPTCAECRATAAYVSRDRDGKYAFSCEAHATLPAAIEIQDLPKHLGVNHDAIMRLNDIVVMLRQEVDMLSKHAPKRFFSADDGGVDYAIVAADLDHAKQLLRMSGVEFMTNIESPDDPWYGLSVPVDDPRSAAEWNEIPADKAANIRVATGEDGNPPILPLTECKVGDWFCSEW